MPQPHTPQYVTAEQPVISSLGRVVTASPTDLGSCLGLPLPLSAPPRDPVLAKTAALLRATTVLEVGPGREEEQEGSPLTAGTLLCLRRVMKAELLGLGLQVPSSPGSLGAAESSRLPPRWEGSLRWRSNPSSVLLFSLPRGHAQTG